MKLFKDITGSKKAQYILPKKNNSPLLFLRCYDKIGENLYPTKITTILFIKLFIIIIIIYRTANWIQGSFC